MMDAIGRLTWWTDPVDQLWSDAWSAPRAAYPALNIRDEGESFQLEAELPGLRIEDIDLAAAGSELRIRGKREAPSGKDWTPIRQERLSGEFFRTVTLPAPIDAEYVQASLKDGVLRVTLPKAPSAKPRKIDVKVLGHKK